jgi:anaerobic selenocysteine-containing dehydrogenase
MEDGKPIRVTGNRESPVYHGFCCTRGQALPEVMASPERLLHSMKRGADGRHQAIGSQQAIAEVAEHLRDIRDRHGPRAIALYFGTYSANYPASNPLAIGLMLALGSPMIFASMTIDQPGKDVAAALLGGWEAGPHGFLDADVWMLVGSNPLVSIGAAMPAQNPGRLLTEAVARGMKLIVIDPRRTQTARRAQIHLQPRPGEDAALLAAMIQVILTERLEDAAFLRENVDGVEALRAAVAPFTPAYAAARADVPAEQIIEAARVFARARRGVAGGATGANMSGRSTLVEYLILCLNTLCGRFLREGEAVANPGVLLARATPKAQPSAPRPARFPDEPMAARGLTRSASGMPTAALADEILAGKVKALLCLGGNPVAAWPEQRRTIAALESIDLFVTLDIKMSASAKLAHYVMAPKIGLEVPNMSYVTEHMELYAGIWGMSQPFGMYAPKLMETPPGSDLIEEWEFFHGVARHLQLQLKMYYFETLTSTRRESRAPVDLDMDRKPTTDELYELITRGSRIPLDAVKRHPNGAVFPESIVAAGRDPQCAARLQVGDAGMMTELSEVAAEAMDASAEFPYRLICRRSAHVYNSTGRDLPLLIQKGGRHNPAFMNPADLADLGLKTGDVVRVSSRHGDVLAIVEAEDALRRGLVSMTHAFGDLPRDGADFRIVGTNTSQLTSVEDDFDRYSGIPRMSALPVNVVAVGSLPDVAAGRDDAATRRASGAGP